MISLLLSLFIIKYVLSFYYKHIWLLYYKYLELLNSKYVVFLELKYLALLSLIFILFFLHAKVIGYNKRTYMTISLEMAKKNHGLFLKYLDQYYIINMKYTIMAVIFYLLGYIMPMITLRFLIPFLQKTESTSISQKTELIKTSKIYHGEITFYLETIIPMLVYMILLLIVLILFSKLLNELFFREVLKLHIFLENNKYYCKLGRLTGRYFIDFFGSLYLFCFNISRLDPYTDSSLREDCYEFNEFDIIYDSQRTLNLSKKCVHMAKKYVIIQWFFILLTKVLRILYLRLRFNGIMQYSPYILYFAVMFYDIIHLKIYYSWYAFFPFYLSMIIIKFIRFRMDSSAFDNTFITDYFYKAHSNYAEQREILHYDADIYLFHMKNNKKHRGLLFGIINGHKIEYVLNSFSNSFGQGSVPKRMVNRYYAISRRYAIMIFFFMVICYVKYDSTINFQVIIYDKITTNLFTVLLVLFCLGSYWAINIFKTKDLNDQVINHTYNRKYFILFWFITLLEIYLFVTVIMRNAIYLMPDHVLWEGFGIKIINNYSIEEKKEFLFNYFNHILIQCQTYKDMSEIVKTILMEYAEVIHEETKIKDLACWVMKTINNYNVITEEKIVSMQDKFQSLKLELEVLKLKQEQMLEEKILVTKILNFINLAANSYVIPSVLIAYYHGWLIVSDPIRTFYFIKSVLTIILNKK